MTETANRRRLRRSRVAPVAVATAATAGVTGISLAWAAASSTPATQARPVVAKALASPRTTPPRSDQTSAVVRQLQAQLAELQDQLISLSPGASSSASPAAVAPATPAASPPPAVPPPVHATTGASGV